MDKMKAKEPKTAEYEQPYENPNQEPPIDPAPAGSGRRSAKKMLLLGLAAVLVLAATGGLYWRYGRSPQSTPKRATQATATPLPSATPASKAALLLQRFTHPTTGETWLAAPIKLPAQGFLRDSDSDADYYQVGQRGNATIIMSDLAQVGELIVLYEKTPDGKVAAITHPDGEAVYNATSDKDSAGFFAAKVTLNTTTHYDSLTMPLQLPLSQGYTVAKPTYPSLGNYTAQPSPTDTALATFGASKLVRGETKYVDTKLTSIGYALLTPIHTRIPLTFQPLELNLQSYQWATGTSSVTDTISPITRGCGGATTAVSRADAVTAADVQVAGKSPSGITVYELKSPDHPLMAKAYQEFMDFYQGVPASQDQYAGISKAEFTNQHGLVLAQDNYGQWLVFARDQLRPSGGCAKPVIYLYPQQAEQVSVRVGAEVKVSAPHYDPNQGWSVWATPGGTLSVGGSLYSSLFWEGPGLGAYPGITSGTVVARSQAATTIRRQLAQQGLVGREIDDFMAYWEPKLPNKPYIRLTWFNTPQMNTLAPLAISPRPTTLIRVFLDFDGLDQPLALPSQHLSAVARQGFTVVEWGGLANFPLN